MKQLVIEAPKANYYWAMNLNLIPIRSAKNLITVCSRTPQNVCLYLRLTIVTDEK
jgi:hypothetical protein